MLNGKDTTIIVQFFGTPVGGVPSIPIARAESVTTNATPAAPIQITPESVVASEEIIFTPTPQATNSPSPIHGENENRVLVSPFQMTKNLSMGIVGIILLALSIDLIIIKRRRIARIGGRTLAHIAFLSMILAVILLLKAGRII